jgi:DNA-binding NtrC family response regulator
VLPGSQQAVAERCRIACRAAGIVLATGSRMEWTAGRFQVVVEIGLDRRTDESVDVRLTDLEVALGHGELLLRGNLVDIVDLQSMHGTFRLRFELSGAPPLIPTPLKSAREHAIRTFEHAYLVELLAHQRGSVTAAARAAGVDRAHFYRLLWKHGLK